MITPLTRTTIYDRDGGLCGICALPVIQERATIDHVIPRSRGGSDDPANLQIAHHACNSRKGYALSGEPRPVPWPVPMSPITPPKDRRIEQAGDGCTVAEAAQELGVSVRAVQNRIGAGEMDAEKVTPRLYLIPRGEVERWKPVGKRKGGRPRKAPTTVELRRDQTEHQDVLEQGRRRIRGEEDGLLDSAEDGQPS